MMALVQPRPPVVITGKISVVNASKKVLSFEEIGTSSDSKLIEYAKAGLQLKRCAGFDVTERQLTDPETEMVMKGDFEAAARSNALSKAVNAFKKYKRPILVEDTQLYPEDIQMALVTGPYIKNWSKASVDKKSYPGLQELCLWARRINNINVKAICTLAVYDGNQRCGMAWSGIVEGQFAESVRESIPNSNSFGWASIFIPMPYFQIATWNPALDKALTFSQMTLEDKIKLFSPRVRAVEKFRDSLT